MNLVPPSKSIPKFRRPNAIAATLVHLSDRPFDEERVREAVLRGCAAGALACTDYGAMRALPTEEDLERFMAGRAAG